MIECAGGIWWDRPYGLNIEEWDKSAFTEADDLKAFQSINCINFFPKTVMVTHQHLEEVVKVKKAAMAHGFRDSYQFITYKPAQNAKGANRHINAVDNLLIHWKAGMQSTPRFFENQNPVARHNHMMIPMLRSRHKSSLGDDAINKTEKHPLIAYTLSQQLFPRGLPVLVIGSGSGGEVVGLVRAGFNVVAMDMDVVQINGLHQRLLAESGECPETKEEMEDYRRQAQSDYLEYQVGIPANKIPGILAITQDVVPEEPKEPTIADRKLVVSKEGCTTCAELMTTSFPGYNCQVCLKPFHDDCMFACDTKKHRVCGMCKGKCPCVPSVEIASTKPV